MEFNNGACYKCRELKCEFCTPVTYTDDEERYTVMECINPKTGYWFNDCPKGLSEYERES